MNNQPKVLLTIEGIEGATLHSNGIKKVKFVIRKKDLYNNYTKKDADKVVRAGTRKIEDWESVPCKKSIKLSYDAYNYMISKEVPEWYYKKDWSRLTTLNKLELHLQRICKAERGTNFNYSILED
jgi:hypothetical protein